MLNTIKRLVLICCVLGYGLSSVWAQHYVFIESDGQPFYAKKAGKLYSSSANGFLIIPKLADSVVALSIGFPRNQYPELNFQFALMDRDRGFQLRKLDDKGWVLFDRSTMETVGVGALSEEKKVAVQQDKKGFADVLMEVTGDSTLVSNSKSKKSEEKVLITKEKVEAKVELPAETKQVIAVVNNNKEEQVDIEIDTKEKSIKPMPVKAEAEIIKPKEEVKVEDKVEKASKPVDDKAIVNTVKSIRICSSPFANEKDVKGLKKKILGIVSDQDIIDAVIKAMGERCYNCRQLAELSWMFTDEQVRLKLFQRAYAWVSDPDKFSDLESTLVQDSTIAAFRNIMSQSN